MLRRQGRGRDGFEIGRTRQGLRISRTGLVGAGRVFTEVLSTWPDVQPELAELPPILFFLS